MIPELQYSEQEISEALNTLGKMKYFCPICKSPLFDNKTEKLLLQRKKIIRQSIIPEDKYKCSNFNCKGQDYFDKIAIENRKIILEMVNALLLRIKKLEEK